MESPHSPTQSLAAQIARQLVEAGLILPASEAACIRSLTEGSLRENEWLILLNAALPQPQPDEHEAP